MLYEFLPIHGAANSFAREGGSGRKEVFPYVGEEVCQKYPDK